MIKDNEEKQEKRKTILVVDDEIGIRESIRILLESKYTVITAAHAMEGWNKYKENKPDLITIDVLMPGENGISFLRRIRDEDSLIPIIIITAYASLENATEAIRLGANNYLIKPFEAGEIFSIVEKLLFKNSPQIKMDHLKNLASVLEKENKLLKEKIENLSTNREKEEDKHEAICASVAHGLKGEFMHISNSIKDIRESAGTLLDIQEECNMIERSIKYGELLLQRLFDYLNMGKPKMEPVDVFELLRRTELLARPRLPSNIQLKIIFHKNMKERTVSANIEQLMGVLIEIIHNASNVLSEKGGAIKLKLEEKGDKAAISVKDNGPGIPVELKKKLLKKQVPSKSGLGLGLFLCNKVISELGGELNLQTSPLGRGTTVTILLPMASGKKEP